MCDEYYDQYQDSFLGQYGNRGRGGGTLRRNTHQVNNREGGKNVPQQYPNGNPTPFQREVGDVGQGDPNNPRKKTQIPEFIT